MRFVLTPRGAKRVVLEFVNGLLGSIEEETLEYAILTNYSVLHGWLHINPDGLREVVDITTRFPKSLSNFTTERAVGWLEENRPNIHERITENPEAEEWLEANIQQLKAVLLGQVAVFNDIGSR